MFVKRHHKLQPSHIFTPIPAPSAAGGLFSGEEKGPSDACSVLGPLDKERWLGNALTGCVMNCLQTRKPFTWLGSTMNPYGCQYCRKDAWDLLYEWFHLVSEPSFFQRRPWLLWRRTHSTGLPRRYISATPPRNIPSPSFVAKWFSAISIDTGIWAFVCTCHLGILGDLKGAIFLRYQDSWNKLLWT